MNLKEVTTAENDIMAALFPKVNPYPIRKLIQRRRDRNSNEEWDVAVQKVRILLRNSRAFNIDSVIRDAILCKDIKAPARDKWEAAKTMISIKYYEF